MFSQIITIARNTFVESVRQPIYFIIIAICGLSLFLTTWTAAFSMGYTETSEVSGDNKMVLDIGLSMVFVCGILLAAFLATAVISREIDRKTVLTVVSKPVARTTVVLGKYAGVAGAIFAAVTIMLLFLFMCIRHQVLSTTADEFDGPVLVFSGLAILLSLATAVWCNFFYGWSFTQTCTMLLLPLMLMAYVGVLLVGKEWKVQPLWADFKPEIFKASLCVLAAQLVFAGVATAASSRLGQVMTLVVCTGVFMLGLTSNYLVGRHAVRNEFFAKVYSSKPEAAGMAEFVNPGDKMILKLEVEPRLRLKAGDPVYFGPNPSGMGLVVSPFTRFTGEVTDMTAVSDRRTPPAISVFSSSGRELVLIRTGPEGALASRPPARGDYLFPRPTEYNRAALGAWGLIPNVQAFWLLDAVTQNQPIPWSHVGMVLLYALAQVGVFVSAGVMLFQGREVG